MFIKLNDKFETVFNVSEILRISKDYVNSTPVIELASTRKDVAICLYYDKLSRDNDYKMLVNKLVDFY